MIKKYYDTDCNLGFLDGKTVAIMGYGSQGHAHAQNLHESGVDVVVGLRKDSASWAKAEAAGLKVMEVPEAAKAADVVMMLVPDEIAADIYNEQVAPYMKEGDVLMFAHGFNIHFQFVKPAKNIDVIMVGKRVSEDDIELPHPRAHERAFVLVPWLDIDPNAEIAGPGPIADLDEELDTSTVTRRDDVVVTAATGFWATGHASA